MFFTKTEHFSKKLILYKENLKIPKGFGDFLLIFENFPRYKNQPKKIISKRILKISDVLESSWCLLYRKHNAKPKKITNLTVVSGKVGNVLKTTHVSKNPKKLNNRALKGPDRFIPQIDFFLIEKNLASNWPFSASFWSCALRFSEIFGQVLIRSFPGSFGFFRTTTVYKQSVTVDNDCLVNISG